MKAKVNPLDMFAVMSFVLCFVDSVVLAVLAVFDKEVTYILAAFYFLIMSFLLPYLATMAKDE